MRSPTFVWFTLAPAPRTAWAVSVSHLAACALETTPDVLCAGHGLRRRSERRPSARASCLRLSARPIEAGTDHARARRPPVLNSVVQVQPLPLRQRIGWAPAQPGHARQAGRRIRRMTAWHGCREDERGPQNRGQRVVWRRWSAFRGLPLFKQLANCRWMELTEHQRARPCYAANAPTVRNALRSMWHVDGLDSHQLSELRSPGHA